MIWRKKDPSEQLRALATKGLTECVKAEQYYQKLVLGLNETTTNPEFRRHLGTSLKKHGELISELNRCHAHATGRLVMIVEKFNTLDKQKSALRARAKDHAPRAADTRELVSEYVVLNEKVEAALLFIDMPFNAIMIDMSDALHNLLGAKRRFSLDLAELTKTLAEEVAGAVSGATFVLTVLRQLENRRKAAVNALTDSAAEIERVYDFDAQASALLETLRQWEESCEQALDEFQRFVEHDVPDYFTRLEKSMSGV